MIRLTGTSGIAIYINPDKIIGFNEEVNVGGTFINYGDDRYIVTESPSEVARKVLEWRLALERLKTACSEFTDPGYVAMYETKNLKRLAGLEE